jgi:Tfp pilus assembly protein PilX
VPAPHRDEQGMAMITAILISVVVLGLAVAATGIAISSNNQSARDRTRLQTIDAAEAGLNETSLKMEQSAPASLPCTVSGDLDANPPVHYQVTISYYATWPPTGSPMTCPPTATPAAATVASLGTSTVGSQTPRKMVTQVRLTPRYGGFDTAIFSDTLLGLENNLEIIGDQGNDADVYTNGSVDCNNSLALQGSLLAQGGVTMSSSCSVTEDVYAKNAITMSNGSRIGHNAMSSKGSISLANGAQIDNNATAYDTITLSGSARIGGSRTQDYTSLPDPPAKTLPTIDYDATKWSAAGYTIETHTCDTAKSRLLGGLPDDGRNYVIRIATNCPLTFTNNSSITVRQDVAIIFDGQVTFENKSDWYSGDGEEHSILFINPASTSGTCSSRNPAFSTSNNTSFADELQVFVYTPCQASFNNSNKIKGQFMAGRVIIANNFDLYYSPIPVPGFGDVSGFDQDIAFQREVAP